MALASLLVPGEAQSQTIGPSPPPITTTINVSSGVTTIVGSTDVATTLTTPATNVTGGQLVIDSVAGPSPGAITIQTENGNAVQAIGSASIAVPSGGLSVQTQGGHAFLANGAGSVVTISNGTTITSTGTGGALIAIGGIVNASGVTAVTTVPAGNGHGAIAEGGGTINLDAGNSFSRAGFNAVGLGAGGASSVLTANALVNVTMNGGGAMGVYMHDGGQVRLLPGSTLQMNGTNSIGITVDNTVVPAGSIGSGPTIDLNRVPSLLGQAGSTGVVAINGGSIELQNLTVQGAGAAAGAWARPGSTITITGDSLIDISVDRNPTFYTLVTPTLATPSGQVGSIFSVTGGSPGAGLKSDGPNSLVTSIGTTINVTSALGYAGANTSFDGSIVMIDNTIVTSGGSSFGVRVDSGTVTGSNSSITTAGGGAALLFNFGPGIIDLTNTPVLATGASTNGLSSLNGTPASLNELRMSGGSLTSAEATAISAQGPLNVTVTNGAAVSGGAFLLGAFNQSPSFPQQTVVNLDASAGSELTGDALAQPLAVANINLATASTWTGAAFDVTNVAIDPTSIWTMTASSTVTQQVSNAGLIQYMPPNGDPTQLASYKTLTTTNYLGAGGRIGLNTYLGDDSAPSDRLVIDGGSATGSSALAVANTTGGGALTVADGILVVDTLNAAITSASAFTLGNRVAAGAYEYALFRGGASNPENWYLRSTLIPPAPPPPGPPPPPPPPPVPNYRPEVPTDMVLPVIAQRMGLDMLGTYRDRFGDDYPDPMAPGEPVFCKDPAQNYRCTPTAEQAAVYAGAAPLRMAAWGRIFGETGQADFGKDTMPDALGSFLDHGPSYDFHIWGIQAGMDILRAQHEDGSRDVAGLYLGYARGTADVDGVYGGDAGSDAMNAYSFGGYWTHLGAPGWYVDAVLQGTRYDQAEAGSVLGETLDTSGWGIAASLEGGYPFALGSGWTLEPQAQLVYQHVTLDDGADRFGQISYDDTDALYGRLGGRLARNWTTAANRRMTGWVSANVWSSFGTQADTNFAGLSGANPTTFGADLGGTWGSFGLGLSAEVAENVRLFASGDYNVGFSGGDSWSVGGRLGMKVVW